MFLVERRLGENGARMGGGRGGGAAVLEVRRRGRSGELSLAVVGAVWWWEG